MKFYRVIANKLNALILALVLLPLLLMGMFAYVIGKTTLEENLQKTLRVTSEEVTYQLDEFMVSHGATLSLMASDYQSKPGLKPETISGMLETQLGLEPHFSWLGYLDEKGVLLGQAGRFIGDRPLNAAVLADLHGQAVAGVRLVDVDDRPGNPLDRYVVFIQPVKDARQATSGHLLAQLPLSEIVAVSNRVRIGETGRATLFNHKGTLIGHPVAARYGYNMSHYPVMTAPIQRNTGDPGAVFLSGDGREKYGITTLLPRLQKEYGVKWGVILDQTLQELYRPVDYLIKVMTLLTIATLAIVVGIGMMVGRMAIARPVQEQESLLELKRIAAVAFETQEAILITDANERIVQVNRAFTDITGYTAEEAIGRTPRLLHSGRHDRAFYQAVWQALKTDGFWEGEIWNRRKNGEVYPERATITAIRDEYGVTTHYLANFSDVTQHKLNEERIHQLAFYDPLTHLANRRLLQDRLHQALLSVARNRHYDALLFIDLDHFKTLNDSLGHEAGDLLLKQVAERLERCVREGDTVARPGGDEFIVLLESLDVDEYEAAKQAEAIAHKILDALCQPYLLGDRDYTLTASIGVSLLGKHGETVEELMRHSDLAMYQVKGSGRNAVRFFDPAMQETVNQRSQLEHDLRRAVAERQFELFYQPEVDLQGEIQGYEALVRWHHPERGLVCPDEFIPVAEERGLIVELGRWVLETACEKLAEWARDPAMARMSLSVNISAQQLHQADFVSLVRRAIEQSGADPSRLGLELTESMLMDDVAGSVAKMNELRKMGVVFSLDDFGTGYSSLSYLKNLPVTWLKIDRSFVHDMLDNPNAAAVVRAVIALSDTLGLKVIAEGVESEPQREFLVRLGCEQLQGYLFGHPAPGNELG